MEHAEYVVPTSSVKMRGGCVGIRFRGADPVEHLGEGSRRRPWPMTGKIGAEIDVGSRRQMARYRLRDVVRHRHGIAPLICERRRRIEMREANMPRLRSQRRDRGGVEPA